MNPADGPIEITRPTVSRSVMARRLYGSGLILARCIWIALVLLGYALFFVYFSDYVVSLQQLRAHDTQTFTLQLSSGDVQMLQSIGLSLDFYATCMVIVLLLFQCSYGLVGALIF